MLQSMGSQRVGHDGATELNFFTTEPHGKPTLECSSYLMLDFPISILMIMSSEEEQKSTALFFN